MASKPHRNPEGSKTRAFTGSFSVICNLRAIFKRYFFKKASNKKLSEQARCFTK